MKRFIAVATLFIAAAAPAAGPPCSVRPPAGTEQAEFTNLAKVSMDAARKAAVGSLKGASRQVKGSSLMVERGCLVYAFDIQLGDKPGVIEVLVDAGDAKVLTRKHKSAGRLQAEAAKKEKAARQAANDQAAKDGATQQPTPNKTP